MSQPKRYSIVSSSSSRLAGALGASSNSRNPPLHERLDNRRQNFLHSVYINDLQSAIKNCKSDVEQKAEHVEGERMSLRETQQNWGRFLKNEVHNLNEFNQVMEKFDQEMAKKGAQIIEKETRVKMDSLNLQFTEKDLDTVLQSRQFLQQIGETQKMTVEQIMSQDPIKVIEFLREFESWQIRKLEIIEEQDTLIQRLTKDLKQQEEIQSQKIDTLKAKEKITKQKLHKMQDNLNARRSICERFEAQMTEDDKFVSKDLNDIYRRLITVNERTKYIDNQLGEKKNPKNSEKTSIDLLKDVERRVFYLLDLIDCLPKAPVELKLAEIEKRKKIQESRKSYADQEINRLAKLEKLKQKAADPIPVRIGKPLVPMTVLKTQDEKLEQIKDRKRREFEKTYFNGDDVSVTSQDYF